MISKRRPWHLWLVTIIFLSIYSVGVYDFLMVASHNTAYMNNMYGEAGVIYFTDYPPLFIALFAINIFAGVIGMIIVFWRKNVGSICMLLAAVAGAVLVAATLLMRDRLMVFGAEAVVRESTINLLGFVVATYYWWLYRKVGN